jgi:hypothetical protein
MNFASGTIEVVASLIGNYYATTGSIWFGHWYSHRSNSPFRGFHVLGHHALYPDSHSCHSTIFRAGSGWHDSTVALAPWLILQILAEFLLLPLPIFALCLFEAILLMIAFSYIHVQFHLERPSFAGFKWFDRSHALHLVHHDMETNYMVLDHFWDQRFHTFAGDRGAAFATSPTGGGVRAGTTRSRRT